MQDLEELYTNIFFGQSNILLHLKAFTSRQIK